MGSVDWSLRPFLHCLITQLVDIILRCRNSTVVSIVERSVLLIAALTLGIVLIMTLYAHRLFRLLKYDWVCTILLSFCMFYSPRLRMVLVSACLTIHSFSSGISYFKSIYFYIVCCCFLLLKNKFDLIWFDLIFIFLILTALYLINRLHKIKL